MERLKPVRTKADYAAAMAEIEHLWGAKLGTPEGDRLDILATLVDAYETQHYPMDAPDPIEAIKFRMEQQGLTRRRHEQMRVLQHRGDRDPTGWDALVPRRDLRGAVPVGHDRAQSHRERYRNAPIRQEADGPIVQLEATVERRDDPVGLARADVIAIGPTPTSWFF